MEDQEIIILYRSRSETAISETDKKYGHYCYAIAYNILYDRGESSECVNDTYFKLWKTIPPKIPDILQAFIGKITRNTALNTYEKKKTKKRDSGEIELALSELQECVDMESDVEVQSNKKELENAISDFLQGLEKQKRIIFVLRYWYIMPVKQIAHKQDISEANVKVILFRIRSELKEYLQERNLF